MTETTETDKRRLMKKHLDTCTAHSLTYGGYCLNCGLNAPKKRPKPTDEERREYLRRIGFTFPKKLDDYNKNN